MADEQSDGRTIGDVFLRHSADGLPEVWYQPSRWAYEASVRPEDRATKLPQERVIAFDVIRDCLFTYPITTLAGDRLLKPRYGRLSTIAFEGYAWEAPTELYQLEMALDGLPDPFYKEIELGLGLPKYALPILKAVQKAGDITQLVISKRRATAIEGRTFILAHGEFVEVASVLNRVWRRHQDRSLQERTVFAHNLVLSRHFGERWPEARPPYTPGALHETFSIVTKSQFPLSRQDRAVLFDEVEKRVADMSRQDPERLFQLQRNVELVALEDLIAKFAAVLADATSAETRWQKLLERNPFVLSMAFGYPAVQVRSQATVGAPMVDGSGARIADFLMKNPATNNAGLVEIKTPQTPLLNASPYRGRAGRSGVFGPSRALTEAVAQVLDQRHHLQEEVAAMVRRERGLELETFHLECVVLAGRIPESLEERRSFDIFRTSLKDVRVLTFDELLTKLENLRDLLSGPGAVEQVEELEIEEAAPSHRRSIDVSADEDLF